MKFVLSLFFISLVIVPHAYAERVLMLPKSNDCPIAKPFTPEPHIQSDSKEYRVVYPMSDDGYKVERIQISASEPTELEIIWTAETWNPVTVNVSVSSEKPQCFFGSPWIPANVPAKQIEIRAQKPVKGLAVSFSDVPWDKAGNCSAQQICPTLVKNMNACKLDKDSKDCGYFIDSLHDLALQKECRRSFDTEFVPAIWLCDDIVKKDGVEWDVIWDAMSLLRSLKSQRAQEYYKSKEFEHMLDGEYAEEYHGVIDRLLKYK